MSPQVGVGGCPGHPWGCVIFTVGTWRKAPHAGTELECSCPHQIQTCLSTRRTCPSRLPSTFLHLKGGGPASLQLLCGAEEAAP